MAEEEPLLYDPGSDSDSTERLQAPLRGGGNQKSALQTCCWVLLLLAILASLIGLWYEQVHLWVKYLLTPCEEPLANWCMVSCFTTIFFLLSFLPCLICHAPSYRNALLLGFFSFEVAWTVVGSVWIYRIRASHHVCPGELFQFVWWQLTLTWGGVGLLVPLCGLWMCLRQCEGDQDVEGDREGTRGCSWCGDCSCCCCDNGKELFLSHPPNSPISPTPSTKQSVASSYDNPHSLPPSPSSPYRSPSRERRKKKKKKQKPDHSGTLIPSSSFSSSPPLPSSLPEQGQLDN